ncbi:MAG: acylneuraminate cytidylyltransferase [Anaerolineaceae bacterium]|nr:acylneuraminate cytidylyltransferase [Anaerolineaceae bacterium]
MTKKEILALIPARGNSKSIPRKNIRKFAGYPLIAYSITAALRSKHVTRVIVSTDNEEIARISREFGAETPFMRPDELARDDTNDFPVFYHALRWLEENEGYKPDLIVQLRATSPIIPVGLIDRAIEMMFNHPEADSVRGVVPSGQNPYKMWLIQLDGSLRPILSVDGLKEPYNSPRQKLPQTYWQTGHIDVIRRKTIMNKRSMSGDLIFPIMLDPSYAIDIDTLLEWKRAERIVKEGTLEMIYPDKAPRSFPEKVRMLVLDFDGVLTDNRVWVDMNGKETVAASRSDGMGLENLRKLTNIDTFVISKETNKVVTARCKKIGVPVYQSIEDKQKALMDLLGEEKVNPDEVVYVGNDINDIEVFSSVGYAVVPADAFITAKRRADLVLGHAGGFGAVREICEMLIERFSME